MKKVVVCLLALSASVFAADEYGTKLGTVEVGAGGGIAWLSGNMGRPVAYTRVATSFNRYIATFGELSYIPVERVTATMYNFRVSASSRIISYGGGMQFQAPTGTRVTPYGMFSVGAINAGGSGSVSGFGSFGISETMTGLNFGGGTKIFVTPKLGFDINVRAMRTTSSGAAIVPVGTVGVFYQFNKN